MENVADALKMAAAVFAFVLALGVSISSFSQARYTADVLIQYADRDTVTQYAEDVGVRTRIVGKENIVPTIYRAYKENYRVQFYEADGITPIVLYTKIEDGATVNVNYIDLERDNLGNNWQQDNFIMALLYGTNAELEDQYGNLISFDQFETSLNTGNSIYHLNRNGIYDIIIKNNRFEEKFGVYYPSQAREGAGDNADGAGANVNAQTTTESKMRVISYYIY